MKLKKFKLSEIEEPAWNYNRHPQEQIGHLKRSLTDFSQLKNIVIWEGKVIAGNGLVEAARQLEWTEIEAFDATGLLTEKQAKAFLVADNRTSALALPDEQSLKDLLSEFDDPLDIPGITEDFLKDFNLENELNAEPNEKDDEIPDKAESICKPGDLWQLGEHRLLCGDCTKKEDVDRLMNNEISEMLFTSPPYADMRDYGGCDLSIDTLKKFIPAFYPYAKYQVINLGIKRKDHEIVEYWQEYITEAKSAGYKFLSWNVWDRQECGTIAHQTAMFSIYHEFIFVFGKEYKEINKTIDCKLAGKSNFGKRTRREKNGALIQLENIIVKDKKKLPTVLTITQLKCSEINTHPAMFPVALPTEYIKAMTNENEIVIDPFGGSGTTLIACEKTNRKCRMMEIDEKYCDIIIKRWEDYTGNKAEKIN